MQRPGLVTVNRDRKPKAVPHKGVPNNVDAIFGNKRTHWKMRNKWNRNKTKTKKEFCNYTASSPSSGLENCQFNASPTIPG